MLTELNYFSRFVCDSQLKASPEIGLDAISKNSGNLAHY
jgi:hypothetical protein